jgi:hypothetical protein
MSFLHLLPKGLCLSFSILKRHTTCLFCKKLKDHVKRDEGDVCNLTEKDSDEVVLEESDHKDLSKIVQTIFPECSVKMQSFLMSQKWPYLSKFCEDNIKFLFFLIRHNP